MENGRFSVLFNAGMIKSQSRSGLEAEEKVWIGESLQRACQNDAVYNNPQHCAKAG